MSPLSEPSDSVRPFPPAGPRQLRREIGLWSAASVVVASMIGQMIFTSSGFMGHGLQHPGLVLLVWVLGAAYAIVGVLCYSELGTLIPRPGGEYAYLREAFGPATAFLSGWASFLGGFSAPIALCALAFVEHGATFWDTMNPQTGFKIPLPWGIELPAGNAIACAVILALTYAHYLRVSSGVRLQNVLTSLKAGAILLMVGVALASGAGRPSLLVEGGKVPPIGDLLPLLGFQLILVTFAYSGWNSVTYLGGEVREPRRTIPRAGILGTLMVTAIYLVVNCVYLMSVPVTAMENAPNIAKLSAAACFPGIGERVISAVVMLVTLASTSALVLTGSRVYFAMGEDGVAWRGLARVTGQQATPRAAVLLQGLVAAFMALYSDFRSLANYSGTVVAVFSGLAVASLFVLRRRYKNVDAYRAPLGPVFPGIYLAATCAILASYVWGVVKGVGADPRWQEIIGQLPSPEAALAATRYVLKLPLVIGVLSILAGLGVYAVFRRIDRGRPQMG